MSKLFLPAGAKNAARPSFIRQPARPGPWSRLVLLLCLLAAALPAQAQVPDSARTDSLGVMSPDTARVPADGDLKSPVQFSSQDSLVILLEDGKARTGSLYNTSKVTYEKSELNAWRIDLDFDAKQLEATGLQTDSALVGEPTFQDGQDNFTGTRLAYNLETERGRVIGAQTRLDDGFIRAGVVKVREDSTLFIQQGYYTTCNCVADPSYSLKASKMKIVDQEWIYTGPIRLYLFNIPTPLWLPFGFLPAKEGRRPGPLPPNYGEDERGFFLRDWGYYWSLSQYTDMQLRFGIWTKGSWQVSPLFRYNRRYRYSGQFQIDYVRNRQGEHGDPDFAKANTQSIRWNHSQTISPTANFNANVDLSSAGYKRAISEDYQDRVRQTISSSIRYSKRWPTSQRSFTIDMNQQQMLATGDASIMLPNLSFSQGSRKPFARRERPADSPERWYERITYSYNSSLTNRYSFTRLRDADSTISWWDGLISPYRYRKATGRDGRFDFRATHSVPVSASFEMTRLPVLNTPFRMNFSGSANYSEDWYANTIRQSRDTTGRIVQQNIPGFFAFRRFSSGVSANTTIYGLFPWRVGPLNGFRHTVRPSLSMSFSPDFTTDFWGYTRYYQNTDGSLTRYPIVNAGVSTRQQMLSLNVSNVVESKVANRDTTNTEQQARTIQILDFNFNTGYNFAADSFRLADISLDARTSIANKFHFTLNTGFSPYQLDPEGTRIINRYYWSIRNPRLFRLTRLDFSARTSFSSRGTGESRPYSPNRARMGQGMDPMDPTMGPQGPGAFGTGYNNTAVGYADFAIPWSINLDFTYSLSKPYLEARHRAIVNSSFDFNLTPNWKVQARTGYDLVERELATTNLVILRDFECWEMSLSWIPFGAYQSFGFDLHVKSGKLRDILRIQQPRQEVGGRFSRITG